MLSRGTEPCLFRTAVRILQQCWSPRRLHSAASGSSVQNVLSLENSRSFCKSTPPTCPQGETHRVSDDPSCNHSLRTPGPQDPRTPGPQDPRTPGPQDLRTPGPQDLRTSGPQDPRTSGPQDQVPQAPTTTSRPQDQAPKVPAKTSRPRVRRRGCPRPPCGAGPADRSREGRRHAAAQRRRQFRATHTNMHHLSDKARKYSDSESGRR